MTTMDYTTTLQALRRLKVETGSLVCCGCGHEHNCSTHGCAVLRNAVEHMEAALYRCDQLSALLDQREETMKATEGMLSESEAARIDLDRRLTETRKQADELTAACAIATDKANRAIAERQAMERDLASCLTGNCTCCSHINDNPACECECLECRLSCYCRDCVDGSKFQWRGMDGKIRES